MNIITKIILVIILVVAFFIGGMYGLERQEQADCYQLQKQSKEISHDVFYITKVEREMCEHHQIPINAPVK